MSSFPITLEQLLASPDDMMSNAYLPSEINTDFHQDHQHHQDEMMFVNDNNNDDPPKKRSDIWGEEETKLLISLRRELHNLFNKSKSNKHLWGSISSRMKEIAGFNRSSKMCIDKWKNLMKEYKKAKQQKKSKGSKKMLAKMSYYKEIDDILKARSWHLVNDTGNAQADEGSGPSLSDLEIQGNHITHALAITSAIPPNGDYMWGDASALGSDNHASSGERVITVLWGEYTRRIAINGTPEAIKDTIRAVFGIRSKRLFWLEDESEVVHIVDKGMPQGTYTLHVDSGIAIKLFEYDETQEAPVFKEDETLYTEKDLREFLKRRKWVSLRELNGYRTVDSINDLCHGGMYEGVKRRAR